MAQFSHTEIGYVKRDEDSFDNSNYSVLMTSNFIHKLFLGDTSHWEPREWERQLFDIGCGDLWVGECGF